jgi:hypothetical protein
MMLSPYGAAAFGLQPLSSCRTSLSSIASGRINSAAWRRSYEVLESRHAISSDASRTDPPENAFPSTFTECRVGLGPPGFLSMPPFFQEECPM